MPTAPDIGDPSAMTDEVLLEWIEARLARAIDDLALAPRLDDFSQSRRCLTPAKEGWGAKDGLPADELKSIVGDDDVLNTP